MSSSSSSPSLKELRDAAADYAVKAVELDRRGQYESAAFFYLEASQALINFKQRSLGVEQPPASDSSMSWLNAKLDEYISRAETLKQVVRTTNTSNSSSSSNNNKSDVQRSVERVLYMLSEAVGEDTAGNARDAFALYSQAIELFLAIEKTSAGLQRLHNLEQFKTAQRSVEKALDRAETLKAKLATATPQGGGEPLRVQTTIVSADLSTQAEAEADGENHAGAFSRDEIAVLRHGSCINGRDYVPFLSSVDIASEKFSFPLAFSDKSGKLTLSPTQRERFARWLRPDEMYETPTLMMLVSSFSVKQTCISDCSFVASLTVCAQYERKFNKTLISNIIYPQNKKGEPLFNPCGKYMVRLNLNGCVRKVIIDDYLPVDSQNNLLCSMTTNRGELWVSLLEKAYLKVMGGYDFPGSNSNIDLHALTNWIPERISLHGEHTEFTSDADFARMFARLHSGDLLITIATGPMSKQEEERTGLVATHAYAVLDIRQLRGGSLRMFQLKNPWSHLRWKGNYSEYDANNWTEELKAALNYDPKLACHLDNGVFWIDYDSLIKFFDVLYLSWKPDMFPYTMCFHKKWSASEGPIKDRFNLGDNPQYVVRVRTQNHANSVKKCTTWLLLTRHITDKADFAENKEYITLIVYKNGGKRVYYPTEPPPFKDGVRINSPHYLVKLVDDCNESTLTYTLVISQYEKNNSVYYTLRAFSTMAFQMSELREPYNPKFAKKIAGQWTQATAGGCQNNQDTYANNPLYQLTIANSSMLNSVKLELKGPQQYSVGFDVQCVQSNAPANPKHFAKITSGDFRKGFCVLLLDQLSGGVYTIRPCTFLAGQEGPFILEVEATCACELALLK